MILQVLGINAAKQSDGNLNNRVRVFSVTRAPSKRTPRHETICSHIHVHRGKAAMVSNAM